MTNNADRRTWVWKVDASFNPEYDATASPDGISYNCEIQGPFCGYDAVGSQSWEQFLNAGPLERVEMPADIAAEIRAFGLALRR